MKSVKLHDGFIKFNLINLFSSPFTGHAKPSFPGNTSSASAPTTTNASHTSSPQTSFTSHHSNQSPPSRLPTAFSIPSGVNLYGGASQRPGPSSAPSMMTAASRKEQPRPDPTKSLLASPIDFHNLPKHWIWNTTSLLYASYASSHSSEQLHRSSNQEMHYNSFPGSAFTSLRSPHGSHGSGLGLSDSYRSSLIGSVPAGPLLATPGRDSVDLVTNSDDSQTENYEMKVSKSVFLYDAGLIESFLYILGRNRRRRPQVEQQQL